MEEGRDGEKWVRDSSVDHKGRVPLRASTGVWKASFFIIATEFCERLCYSAIVTSLIIYLTTVIHQDLKIAVKNVNYWTGVTTLMPLLGGFLVDGYLGRFFTVLASSIIYLMGLLLMTMSRVIQALKPCETERCKHSSRIHGIVFFTAIYLVSVGIGVHNPSLESFGADQFDDHHSRERVQKMSFFNWWSAGICAGSFLGVTIIAYIQDHVSWALADIIITITMATSIIVFCLGRPFYRFKRVHGNPLPPLLKVFAAAFIKRNLPYPSDSSQLYEDPNLSESTNGRLLAHTNQLKFLDKAAIIDMNQSLEEQKKSWKLIGVTEVEETKLLINMIPVWLASMPFGICQAQSTTFFIKQGFTLNRNIGHGFELPPASLYALSASGVIISAAFYDRILNPILQKITKRERSVSILQRIGAGNIFSVAAMIIAGIVEHRRLEIVNSNGNSSSMSVFWLVPQFLILGLADGFTLVGLQEYFYDQVPDSIRSLGIAFYLSVLGAANFASSLLITILDHITKKTGNSWFGVNLKSSRLDYFYWFLATITATNLLVYVLLIVKRYRYKNVKRATIGVADYSVDIKSV